MEQLDDIFVEDKYSNKSYGIAVCLSGIFGILGVQHFYLERWGMGMFDLGMSIIGFTLLMSDNPIGFIFLAVDFVHTIYVTYKLLVGEYKDGDNKIIPYPGQKRDY